MRPLAIIGAVVLLFGCQKEQAAQQPTAAQQTSNGHAICSPASAASVGSATCPAGDAAQRQIPPQHSPRLSPNRLRFAFFTGIASIGVTRGAVVQN